MSAFSVHKVKITDAPKPEVDENAKEFRMRSVLWITETFPGRSAEEVHAIHNRIAGKAGYGICAKESVVRTLKTLVARGRIERVQGEEDRREATWSAV